MTCDKCKRDGGKPEDGCPVCGEREQPDYWCEECEQVVPKKRCPLCGLKARKIRG